MKKVLTLVAIALSMVMQCSFVQAQAPKPEQKAKFAHKLNSTMMVPQALTYSMDDYNLITLWWSPNLSSISYFVYMSSSPDGEFTNVAWTDRTSWADRPSCGEVRYYFVTAFDGTSESWPSNVLEVHGHPCISKVKGLKVSVTHPGYPTNSRDVTLFWEYDPNVITYRIYSWTSWETNIRLLNETSFDWNQQSLPCGFAVVYWVTAVVGTYETPWSDPIVGVVSCDETTEWTTIPGWTPGTEPTIPAEKKVFIPFAARP